MKLKEEEEANEVSLHCQKRSTDNKDHGKRKKVKSGSKSIKNDTESNRKHHKSCPEHSNSEALSKPLQESKITSSEKVQSDSGICESEANGIKDGKEETRMESLERSNNLMIKESKPYRKANKGSKKYGTNKTSRHRLKDKSKKLHANVKHSDNSHKPLTAVENEENNDELQIFCPISDDNDAEIKKEKSNSQKNADDDKNTDNKTKSKTEDKKKKRNSSSIDQDEPRKNKKAKKEDNKDKQKLKEDKEEKQTEETSNWKWWEEGKHSDGQKWKSFEHKGPLFPPEYEPLPSNVLFLYDEEPVKLSLAAEEVASFYAKMLDHEYTTKEIFQNNFFTDWKEVMTEDERKRIKEISKCDFSNIHKYFVEKAEEKKNMTKNEKQVLKDEALKLTEEYGYCLLDGHKEKIGNFRIEPPGLFRGRGEHPKMGKLKNRVKPEDVIINCSQDSKIPAPPAGHRWKRVQHENSVTWLASWVENIHGHIKYIMLNPSSKLKGEKDWQKYETARKLKLRVDSIRSEYQEAWSSREMKQRQRGVALYFIDKLALRAGNEKDDDTADTVGCCSLRVEHISLHRHLDDQDFVVEFDFLGKDSIRYYNKVPVEKRVFKNLKLFMESKDPEDDLFDRITTMYLNKKLNEAMPGLTAKVFRTYNASTTLQEQLHKLTSNDVTMEEKILAYNRANRAVAVLCNHQRAAPKTFEKSMLALQEKIKKKKEDIVMAKKELKQAEKKHKECPSDKSKKLVEKKEKALKRLSEQLKKLKLQETDKEENKVIALGTSKLNYLDPRITVAWCKKHNVPVEKIYNKTQRAKFAWAIDMTDENFLF